MCAVLCLNLCVKNCHKLISFQKYVSMFFVGVFRIDSEICRRETLTFKECYKVNITYVIYVDFRSIHMYWHIIFYLILIIFR